MNESSNPISPQAVQAMSFDVKFAPHAGIVWIRGQSEYANLSIAFTIEQAIEVAQKIKEIVENPRIL